MVVQLFLFIMTPTISSFETEYKDNLILYILQKYVSVIILIAEICISFNKGYYDEGMIITNRKLIIKQYIKNQFLLDIFNVICGIAFEELHILLIFAASIFRMVSLSLIWTELKEYLEIQHKFPTFCQIIDLMFLIFYIAHLCACGFFYVSRNDYNNNI